jgi:LuxR family maltose regulon positive regulatory protein
MIGLGNLLREWNELEAAETQLNEGIDLVRNLGVIGTLDGYIALARVKQAQGDPRGAQQVMDTVHKIATRFDASDLDDLIVDLYRARLWLLQNQVEAAEHWHREWVARRQKDEQNLPYVLQELDQVLCARILLARNKPEACLKIVRQLQKHADQLGRTGVVLETLVIQCLAFSAKGDREKALQSLEQALSLAEPEDYLRIFLDEGPAMAQLLYQTAERGIHREYVGRILPVFPPNGKRHYPADSKDQLIEPLSQREMEVLQLLAGGSSNKEVARRLFISLPTVKWHTSNIYGKLSVQNRTQAVARARSLGLISP